MIPQCLSHLANERRWVGWCWEQRGNEKPAKPPRQANGQYARTNDWSTWATLEEIQSAGFEGVGLNLLGLKGIAAIDLDNVRDPTTGAVSYAWAEQVIRCGSYAEVTPSGTGFRVIGTTSLPAMHVKGRHPEGGEEEIYIDAERYITVTGQRVEGVPDELCNIDAVIAAMREAPQAQLPADIMRRIAANAVEGERSSAFQGVVNSCVNRGLRIEQVESAMRAHPDGISNKYLTPADRLTKELKRSWDDATEKGYAVPQEARSKRRPFKLTPIGELEMKKPEFLIDGLIEMGGFGQLFGDPGVGKSFVALEWALCVASGKSFLGKPVRQGPVVYIAGEGNAGLIRRSRAWAKHNGIDLEKLPLHLSGGATAILDREALEDVKEAIRASGPAPLMIVVDTLARNFGNGDENSSKDMSAFVAALDDVKAEFPGCVVLVVHHTGHTEKQRGRGSMALKGGADFEYRLEAKDAAMLLTNVKMKDSPLHPPITLELRQVDLGDMCTSAVILPGAAQQPTGGRDIRGVERTGLAALFKAARSSGVRNEADGTWWVSRKAWKDASFAAQGEKAKSAKDAYFRREIPEVLAHHGVKAEEDGYRLDHVTAMGMVASDIINT